MRTSAGVAMNVAHHQRDRGFLAPFDLAFADRCVSVAVGFHWELAFEAVDAELAPSRREIGFGKLANNRQSHTSL